MGLNFGSYLANVAQFSRGWQWAESYLNLGGKAFEVVKNEGKPLNLKEIPNLLSTANKIVKIILHITPWLLHGAISHLCTSKMSLVFRVWKGATIVLPSIFLGIKWFYRNSYQFTIESGASFEKRTGPEKKVVEEKSEKINPLISSLLPVRKVKETQFFWVSHSGLLPGILRSVQPEGLSFNQLGQDNSLEAFFSNKKNWWKRGFHFVEKVAFVFVLRSHQSLGKFFEKKRNLFTLKEAFKDEDPIFSKARKILKRLKLIGLDEDDITNIRRIFSDAKNYFTLFNLEIHPRWKEFMNLIIHGDHKLDFTLEGFQPDELLQLKRGQLVFVKSGEERCIVVMVIDRFNNGEFRVIDKPSLEGTRSTKIFNSSELFKLSDIKLEDLLQKQSAAAGPSTPPPSYDRGILNNRYDQLQELNSLLDSPVKTLTAEELEIVNQTFPMVWGIDSLKDSQLENRQLTIESVSYDITTYPSPEVRELDQITIYVPQDEIKKVKKVLEDRNFKVRGLEELNMTYEEALKILTERKERKDKEVEIQKSVQTCFISHSRHLLSAYQLNLLPKWKKKLDLQIFKSCMVIENEKIEAIQPQAGSAYLFAPSSSYVFNASTSWNALSSAINKEQPDFEVAGLHLRRLQLHRALTEKQQNDLKNWIEQALEKFKADHFELDPNWKASMYAFSNWSPESLETQPLSKDSLKRGQLVMCRPDMGHPFFGLVVSGCGEKVTILRRKPKDKNLIYIKVDIGDLSSPKPKPTMDDEPEEGLGDLRHLDDRFMKMEDLRSQFETEIKPFQEEQQWLETPFSLIWGVNENSQLVCAFVPSEKIEQVQKYLEPYEIMTFDITAVNELKALQVPSGS